MAVDDTEAGLPSEPPSSLDSPTEASLLSRRHALAAITLSPLVSLVACTSENDGKDLAADSGGPSPTPRRDGGGASSTARDAGPDASFLERRYTALATAFVDAYNSRDIQAVASFFSDNATLTVNGLVLEGREAIRAFWVDYGAAEEGASFVSAAMTPEVFYFAGDALLLEGRIFGIHEGELSGFAPSGQSTVMAFALFFRFNEEEACASCNSILNRGALLPMPVL